MNFWEVLIGILLALLFAWAALVIALMVAAPDRASLKQAVRLLPDLLRLLGGLSRERQLPRWVRWLVIALLVYLALPIDLIPDFIPVLGYADDAIAILIVLRVVLKAASDEVLAAHWSGTPEGLAALYRLTGHHPESPAPE